MVEAVAWLSNRGPPTALIAEAFEDVLLIFPAGEHDDQVDALGLVGQLMDKMVRGTARKPEAKAPKDSWARLFDRQDLGVADWRIA